MYCNKPLSIKQKIEVLIGKQKGYCSRECSSISQKKQLTKCCIVCGNDFTGQYQYTKNKKVCSTTCAGKLSSKRMIEKNPMKSFEIRKKVSKKLKEINQKPIIKGGKGRGTTIHKLKLYNELIKIDNSFEMELIEKTGRLKKQFKSPNHYKLDIASRLHKLCIEVDGRSHKSKETQECDKRKTELLNLKGWKVLRLSNEKILNELENCVQMVMSMI